MSIRTIIEINHDQLDKLDDPEWSKELADSLATGDWRENRTYPRRCFLPQGVRVLGQRHHSETLKLEVK